jgi:hypothetical protein
MTAAIRTTTPLPMKMFGNKRSVACVLGPKIDDDDDHVICYKGNVDNVLAEQESKTCETKL